MFSIDISFRALVVVLFALFGLPGLTGCISALQSDKLLDSMQGATISTIERMGEDSLSQFQVGGQAINPGIKARASVSYELEVGYDGLAGQFQAAGTGKLDRAVPIDRILNIYQNSSLSAAERLQKISDLINSGK